MDDYSKKYLDYNDDPDFEPDSDPLSDLLSEPMKSILDFLSVDEEDDVDFDECEKEYAKCLLSSVLDTAERLEKTKLSEKEKKELIVKMVRSLKESI